MKEPAAPLRLSRGQVLVALRAGQALLFQHSRSGPCWSLSDGRPVESRVAKMAILDPEIVGEDDALLCDATPQTFRAKDSKP
jgi:hypothetical protein